MITDLWIENFKGIGKRQHIPLRPVTLLFGANSAGKSTVLHALLYLRGILRSGEFDPTQPLDGENTVSLGGVDKLMHRDINEGHPLESFTIEVRFHASLHQVNDFGRRLNRRFIDRRMYEEQQMHGARDADRDSILSCDMEDRTVPINIRFEIRSKSELESTNFDDTDTTACLKSLQISIDGLPILDAIQMVEFSLDPSHRPASTLIGFLNLVHPCWQAQASTLSQDSDTRVLRGISGACSLQNLDHSSDSNECIFVSDILRLPKFECYTDEGAGTWLSDNYPSFLQHTSLDIDMFLGLKQITGLVQNSGNLTKAIDSAGDSNGDCDLILQTRAQTENIEELSIEDIRAGLIGIRFQRTSLPVVDAEWKVLDVVGLIRTLLSTEVEINCLDPGKCANALYFDWYELEPGKNPHFDPEGVQSDSGRVNLFERRFGLTTHDVVSRAIKGSLSWLRDIIDDMVYVGPKRSMVPRDLTSESAKTLNTWGNGLAAWRWILENDPEAVRNCNRWLNEGFETKLSLAIKCYREISTDFHPGDEVLDFMDETDPVEARRVALERLAYAFEKSEKSEIRKLHVRKDNIEKEFQPQDLGEGITQVVPVIAACVKACREGGLVAIEQPELHLHPSLAARLGDLFLFAALAEKQSSLRMDSCLLAETHSEHLILRILRRIRQTTNGELLEHIPLVKPDDVCVLWVDNLGDGTTFQRLRIDEQGEFIDRWPQGFFSERAEELF